MITSGLDKEFVIAQILPDAAPTGQRGNRGVRAVKMLARAWIVIIVPDALPGRLARFESLPGNLFNASATMKTKWPSSPAGAASCAV
jgi:hypothetical protein